MNTASLEINRTVDNDTCNALIVRRPILDHQCNVVAYELLFRQLENLTQGSEATETTLSVINCVFSNTDIQTVLGDKKAYIHFDAKVLQDEFLEYLPSDAVVLEVMQPNEVDSALLERLTAAKSRGFSIVLDDFSYHASAQKLLELADYVKLDICALDRTAFERYAQKLQAQGKRILAENVATPEQFALCKSLGCSLFQGCFFTKPEKLTQVDIPASTLRILDIMNNIMADADVTFLERAISHEVSLSYRLLQFVNTAGLSCGRELRTVKQALSMLGRNQLYRWLSLMLYASQDTGLNQSDALWNAALYRGRLMELFCEQIKLENPNELFILGTFSFLEALLNREMEMIIKDMSMPAPIKQALVEQDGRYWPYLDLALSIDSGDIHRILAAAQPLGLTVNNLNQAQLEALEYAEAYS
jgi:EAL and modified HD-GYP domain-containing signal transduction protein